MEKHLKPISSTIIMLFATAFLTSCDSMKTMAGMGKHSPDEFLVTTNDKLEMPKDYSSLPEPGTTRAVSTNKESPKDIAKSAFLTKGDIKTKSSSTVKTGDNPTKAENAFLSSFEKPDPQIRDKITEEDTSKAGNYLFGTYNATVVDPEKESLRIKELQDKGRKITGENSAYTTRKEKVPK